MGHFFQRFWKSSFLMRLRRLKQRWFPKPEHIGIGVDHPLRFTERCRGLIHIGAHLGEEGWIYNALRVPQVIWVEGDPDLMERLKVNISNYRGQVACQALLAEEAGRAISFYVSNNDGASSSILPLGLHERMYPEVVVTLQKTLLSDSLESLLRVVDPQGRVDAMVIDVQGAELSVLRGAGERIKQFRWVFAECADFELYKGCCTVETLTRFLQSRGFKVARTDLKKAVGGVGNAFDVLFVREK